MEASSRYAGVAQNRAWSPTVRAGARADTGLSGPRGKAGLRAPLPDLPAGSARKSARTGARERGARVLAGRKPPCPGATRPQRTRQSWRRPRGRRRASEQTGGPAPWERPQPWPAGPQARSPDLATPRRRRRPRRLGRERASPRNLAIGRPGARSQNAPHGASLKRDHDGGGAGAPRSDRSAGERGQSSDGKCPRPRAPRPRSLAALPCSALAPAGLATGRGLPGAQGWSRRRWRGAGLSSACAPALAPLAGLSAPWLCGAPAAPPNGAEGMLRAPRPSAQGRGEAGARSGLCAPLESGCRRRAGMARVPSATVVPLVPLGPRALSPTCDRGWAASIGRTRKERREGGRGILGPRSLGQNFVWDRAPCGSCVVESWVCSSPGLFLLQYNEQNNLVSRLLPTREGEAESKSKAFHSE